MIIEISSSGGFAGIPAAAMHKRIDVDQQSPQMRQEICDAFEPRDLAAVVDGASELLCFGCTAEESQLITEVLYQAPRYKA